MNELLDQLKALLPQLKALAPKLVLAIAVLLLGFLVSLILRSVARWAMAKVGLDRLSDKTGFQKALEGIGIKNKVSHVVGTIVYFAALLLTVSAVAEVFELPGVAAVTAAMMGFLPKLLAGGFMLLGGFWVASLVRGLIRRLGKTSDHLDAPDVVARVAYYGILVVTAMLAADQAGLETDLADTIVTLVAAAVVFSCGLGFALGSRSMFESVVARHHYSREIQPGDHVRVAGEDGVVVRYTSVAIVLSTEEGEKLIPCKALHDGTVVLEKIATPPSD